MARDQREKQPSVKDLRRSIAAALGASQPELKELLGDKKFTRRAKAAARLLTEGLKEIMKRKSKRTNTAVKSDKKAARKRHGVAARGVESDTVQQDETAEDGRFPQAHGQPGANPYSDNGREDSGQHGQQ